VNAAILQENILQENILQENILQENILQENIVRMMARPAKTPMIPAASEPTT
jgi:hypothetical protein